MKHTIWPLALLLSFSSFAQSLTSAPFYFAATADSMSSLADKTWKKIPVKELETEQAYLRGYFYKDSHSLVTEGSIEGTSNAVIAAKKRVRAAAMADLLKKGIIRNGDVVLSFRPLWENTASYPHIQMGLSHSGIIYVENGVAKNLDQPLDSHHNGENFDSSLNAPHYLGGDTYQIIRPRDVSAVKAKNFLSWVAMVKKNAAAFRSRGQLKFNSDYNASKYNTYSANDSFVTKMAGIISGKDTTTTDLTLFCSEFIWSLLSLSNCSPEEIALDPSSDAACVKPIMSPMPMLAAKGVPGLTEGPLAVLEKLDLSVSEKVALLEKIFTEGDVSRLSGGHRALAKDPAIQKLMGILKQTYVTKLSGKEPPQPMVDQINSQAPLNYSPTSFLINAMLDSADPERKFDYVATIIFTK